MKLTFCKVKKNPLLPVELSFVNVPCCVEKNTVLDTMKHKVSIYLWPELHKIIGKTQNKQTSSLDKTSVLLVGCAFRLERTGLTQLLCCL